MKKAIIYAFAALVAAVSVGSVVTLTRPVEAQQSYTSSLPAVGGVVVRRGAADPTAGAGVAAPRPALYVRTGTDALYLKTGSGNTAWTIVPISGGAASFSSVTATGNITSSAGNITATAGNVRAGLKLEMPVNASAPSLVAYDETGTNTGVSITANDSLVLWSAGATQATVVNTAISIAAITELRAAGGLRHQGGYHLVDPRLANIPTAGTAISTAGTPLVRVTLSAGSISSTAAPLLADGSEGQEICLVRDDDAGNFTISDQATLANTNVRLSATTIVLGPRDAICLKFLSDLGDWVQVSQVNNL